MARIGVRELRQHASRYLALVTVQRGQGEPSVQELLDDERGERL